ncbi:MAG: D-aminoacylase [Candidatus Aminicenantes bacterium]|jgi:N-acyl-D-amino-acid deacylase
MKRREFIKSAFKAGISLSLAGGLSQQRVFPTPHRFDILIKNGWILDGFSDSSIKADLGIVGDRIESFGTLTSDSAKTVINATDKIVSPGFIDIHSHTDSELLINPKAESKIRQGVTTELSGNCGGSMFPHKQKLNPYEKTIKKTLGIDIHWTDLEGYHNLMQKRGTAVNHATLVGQGTVRQHIMGSERRTPTSGEMDTMKKLVAKAMEQGAFGMSTGLEYTPDRFSSTEEIIALCRIVSEYGGFYATHTRSEDTALLEAVGEAIHIAEKAELPLQISHLKAAGRGNYYKIPMVLDLIERARERGLGVSADRYPYTAFATSLSIMFPIWALDGGQKRFVERLKDKDLRTKMKEETLVKARGNNSWESMLIQSVNTKDNEHLVGKYILEAAEDAQQAPYEFVCDLLIAEGGDLSIIGFGMSEENTTTILKHPLVMLASDGVALAPYEKLSEGIPHPRNYGSFPRFLGKYVREEKLVPLPEAIKKMTSMPARKMGLKKRGTLSKGSYADIVVFDPDTVTDLATYTEPSQYPKGIDYVIVNGKFVIDRGEHTGELPGKILHRITT